MGKMRKLTALLLMLGLLASLLCGCVTIPSSPGQSSAQEQLSLLPEESAGPAAGQDELNLLPEDEPAAPAENAVPDEDGSYTTKEDVCAYLIAYGHLPPNFITKSEAQAAGWEGGSLEKYCPGKCIGGDRFGNREGLLPSAKGRTWTECDINTLGARSRGAERIVFSNDGLIYYTGDHYESFQLLYGAP